MLKEEIKETYEDIPASEARAANSDSGLANKLAGVSNSLIIPFPITITLKKKSIIGRSIWKHRQRHIHTQAYTAQTHIQ